MDRFDSADACLEDLRDDFRTNYDRRLSHTMQNSQSGRESISKDGLMRLRSPAAIATKRKFCKQIGNALRNGSEHRRGLPTEIVAHIFRIAGITIPAPEFDQSVVTEFSISKDVLSSPRHLWLEFVVPDENLTLFRTLAKLRLVTYTRHQGWDGDPSSLCWFELAILSCGASEKSSVAERMKREPGGKRLCWLSHYGPRQQDYTSHFDWVVGETFDPQHEIWSYLSQGDSIAVLGSISSSAWSSRGQEALLLFDVLYDPF